MDRNMFFIVETIRLIVFSAPLPWSRGISSTVGQTFYRPVGPPIAAIAILVESPAHVGVDQPIPFTGSSFSQLQGGMVTHPRTQLDLTHGRNPKSNMAGKWPILVNVSNSNHPKKKDRVKPAVPTQQQVPGSNVTTFFWFLLQRTHPSLAQRRKPNRHCCWELTFLC